MATYVRKLMKETYTLLNRKKIKNLVILQF